VNKEDGTWFFSVVLSDRTGGNGRELKDRKFHLNTWKDFFSMRLDKQWSRLPRVIVESPSLDTFKA